MRPGLIPTSQDFFAEPNKFLPLPMQLLCHHALADKRARDVADNIELDA